MKFKVGDKVMLKAVPWDDFFVRENAIKFYQSAKKRVFLLTWGEEGQILLDNIYDISFKYLKHAVKPKPIKYTIDCKGMICCKCPPKINGDVKICKFTGTKSQVEAHIKRYWKQPKKKAVK